jgi:integrase
MTLLPTTGFFVLRSRKPRKGELITVAHESKRKIAASADDEQQLLDKCNTEKRKHLKALIIAAVDTGCRQGELLRLVWRDVEFQVTLSR